MGDLLMRLGECERPFRRAPPSRARSPSSRAAARRRSRNPRAVPRPEKPSAIANLAVEIEPALRSCAAAKVVECLGAAGLEDSSARPGLPRDRAAARSRLSVVRPRTSSRTASVSSGDKRPRSSLRQRDRMVASRRPRLMADEQEERPRGRLLEDLEQRIGRFGVEIVGRIDDADAPAARPRRTAEELAARRASSTAISLLMRLGLGIESALDDDEIGMAARGDAAGHRRIRGHMKRRADRRPSTDRDSGAGSAPGDRPGRLADAARPGDQPGVMHPARAILAQQQLLGALVAEEHGAPARVMGAVSRGSSVSSVMR